MAAECLEAINAANEVGKPDHVRTFLLFAAPFVYIVIVAVGLRSILGYTDSVQWRHRIFPLEYQQANVV